MGFLGDNGGLGFAGAFWCLSGTGTSMRPLMPRLFAAWTLEPAPVLPQRQLAAQPGRPERHPALGSRALQRRPPSGQGTRPAARVASIVAPA